MLKQLLKNRTFLILSCIFILGLFLKLINYWDNQIFAYDQARDAQRMIEIIHGGIKLFGPETDIKGVFNGPLFYYLLAPFYLIFNYDPNLVGLLMILINLSGIPLVFYAAYVIFGKKEIGYLSAFLWAISYEQANFARFISNASFMGISCIVFFLGLALLIFRKNKWGLPLSAIGLGMAVNFNLYLGYLIFFYPIFYLVFKPKYNLKQILLSTTLFFGLISPLFVAEIKFHFMSTKAMIFYLSQHQSGGLLANLPSYPARISGAMHWGFFSFNENLGIILLVSAIIYLIFLFKRNKGSISFLLLWLFSTFPLFFFKTGVLTAEVSNSSIFGAITIVFACVVYSLLSFKRTKYLGVGLLTLIILSNFMLFVKNDFLDQNLFALQPLVLKNEKQLIDYTYTSSKTNSFSVCAATNPLFVNTLWSYLYNFYGKQKYGYIPFWSGQKQVINANLMPYDAGRAKERYLIVEPLIGIADFAPPATTFMEDQISVINQKENFGPLYVEKRTLNFNKGEIRDTQHLSGKAYADVKDLTSIDQRYSCYNTY